MEGNQECTIFSNQSVFIIVIYRTRSRAVCRTYLHRRMTATSILTLSSWVSQPNIPWHQNRVAAVWNLEVSIDNQRPFSCSCRLGVPGSYSTSPNGARHPPADQAPQATWSCPRYHQVSDADLQSCSCTCSLSLQHSCRSPCFPTCATFYTWASSGKVLYRHNNPDSHPNGGTTSRALWEQEQPLKSSLESTSSPHCTYPSPPVFSPLFSPIHLSPHPFSIAPHC